MDYTALVCKVLEHDILSKHINDLQHEMRACNLITEHWKETLESYHIYNLHKNKKIKYNKGNACGGVEKKAFTKRVIDPNHYFKIIVLGEWILKKDEKEGKKNDYFSIVIKKCEPLDLIGLSMQEDEDKKLHTGGRFFIRECNSYYCSDCTIENQKFNINTPKISWCVKNVRIYNGKKMLPGNIDYIQNSLLEMSSFLGIFHMEISNRTSFDENSYKIGGHVLDMTAFQWNALNNKEQDVKAISFTPTSVPSIEFPKEEE